MVLWSLALVTAAVAQEDKARARACSRGGIDDAGREQGEGTVVARVARARQWELRSLGGEGGKMK